MPAIICDVVEEVVELSHAVPQVVAAVALATTAAALGPNILIQQARNRIPICFNVIVSHKAPRTLPWIDAVTAPLLGRIFEAQAALLKGEHHVRDAISQQKKDLQQARQTVAPNPELLARLEAEANRAPASLKPFVATTGMAPKELRRVLPQSFDGGVAIVAVGNDPGADFLRLKTAERAHLSELLNRSWTRSPLSFGDSVHPGNISLLWQTRRSIKDLASTSGFDPDFLPVPTLFFADTSASTRVPEFEHEAEWQRVINYLFDHRCAVEESIFTLSPGADAALIAFAEHVTANLDSAPAFLRPHIAWLPELAPRLAAIFWILRGHADVIIDEATASSAVEATRWIGRQHLSAIAESGAADGAGPADKNALLLAKIRAKAPITRRDLRRTFANQRVKWFDDALDTLIQEKSVRYDEAYMLIPCQQSTLAE